MYSMHISDVKYLSDDSLVFGWCIMYDEEKVLYSSIMLFTLSISSTLILL